jgi:adenylyltransferase/sulfurtransferase
VHHDFEFLAVKKRALVSALCGRKTVQITPIEKGEISLLQLSKKLERVGTVRHTEFTLIFKLPKYVITIFKDGRAVIKGTSDEKLAKSLYARYIGT